MYKFSKLEDMGIHQ